MNDIFLFILFADGSILLKKLPYFCDPDGECQQHCYTKILSVYREIHRISAGANIICCNIF